MPSGKKLVIVESPAKAKTIEKYLGDAYDVRASVGHIRDLVEPKNLPSELKSGSLGKFSVDIENNFEPYYEVASEKKKTVAELKKALAGAEELYLATDEDREGEAIAWHLIQVLRPKVPVKRMVFHEITKEAIEKAESNTRELDENLVDAQETRRILDRLYGYELSPVLWRKVGPGLSAGRVQSAATRLVVDRERERRAFVKAEYWDIAAVLDTAAQGESFKAKLVTVSGSKLAGGDDFEKTGGLKAASAKLTVLTESEVLKVGEALRATDTVFRVSKLSSKPYTKRPSAPFTTSTLQQEASRKLKFSTRQTMSVAQSLYENGYITYMRTDSNALSSQALQGARKQAAELYGADSVSPSPRTYQGKAKNAQEAHEAIRPAGSDFLKPAELKTKLSPNEWKLYDMIWKRTLASQMADAKGSTATVLVEGVSGSGEQLAEFSASGTVITFQGFMQAYQESGDGESETETQNEESRLPEMTEGETLSLKELEELQHFTQPKARYTEASLVKELEERGIGRPSTYAAIISTILDRGYVQKRGQALVPSWIAFSVVRLLEEHFSDLVQYDFTAEMEQDLDLIAAGKEDRVDWLKQFYFGGDSQPGLRSVIDNLGEIDARAINSIVLNDEITLRVGKFGPYLEVKGAEGEDPKRVSVPEELAPDELTLEKAQELIDEPEVSDRVIGIHPESGKKIIGKDGRYGPYVTEEAPEEPVVEAAEAGAKKAKKAKVEKPRTASLFKSHSLATIDLDTAVQLLSLPRTVGTDPESGEEITAQNGRFGPYLKKGTDSRSLSAEEQIFTITLDEALAIYAQPKYGARSASAPLKEFDADPVSGKPVRVKDGRFGPYVTDGTTNATIPKGETPDEMTFERAIELLAIKREKAPAKKTTRARKTAAKK